METTPSLLIYQTTDFKVSPLPFFFVISSRVLSFAYFPVMFLYIIPPDKFLLPFPLLTTLFSTAKIKNLARHYPTLFWKFRVCNDIFEFVQQ
jgi:hypothetical protein